MMFFEKSGHLIGFLKFLNTMYNIKLKETFFRVNSLEHLN